MIDDAGVVMQDVKLDLTLAEVNLILEALGEQPITQVVFWGIALTVRLVSLEKETNRSPGPVIAGVLGRSLAIVAGFAVFR